MQAKIKKPLNMLLIKYFVIKLYVRLDYIKITKKPHMVNPHKLYKIAYTNKD